MKKFLLIVALIATCVITACNNGTNGETKTTDSTVVDSVHVTVAVDTTVVK